MLWLLNRHLFQSTQPEKYATLFLGFYDDQKHRLTYSNAGHLPPIVLAPDGTVRRLETGGTVVGLFHDRDYEEETVELYPGDIFIAFSTANPGAGSSTKVVSVQMLPNNSLDPVFDATVQATEEAVVNAMIAAESMTGIDNHRVTALPYDQLKTVLKKYNRLNQ